MNTMNKIAGCSCGSMFADVAPLVLRVALGAIFAWHGYDKIFTTGLPAVAEFLASVGIPFSGFLVYVLAYGELFFGTLLILGLFTHWAAKFAGVVAIVAFFMVHLKNGFAIGNGGYEFIMLIFASAASLIITGAGKYSLDEMWWKKMNTPTEEAVVHT